MSEVTNIDLSVPQGATYVREVIYTNTDGSLVPLTGFTEARLQFRDSYRATYAYLTLTLGAGLEIDTVTSTITVTITSEQAGALRAATYVYDLEVTDPIEEVTYRVLEGRATVTPEVSR